MLLLELDAQMGVIFHESNVANSYSKNHLTKFPNPY